MHSFRLKKRGFANISIFTDENINHFYWFFNIADWYAETETQTCHPNIFTAQKQKENMIMFSFWRSIRRPYLTTISGLWSCWGLMCLEEGRQVGWLTNWFAGGLLVWTVPVSRSSGAFWPRAGRWATGRQPVNKAACRRPRTAALWRECVCLFSLRLSETQREWWGWEYLSRGRADRMSEWI